MANGNTQDVNDIAGNGMRVAKLTILSASVLTLNTIPIEIIPAPGVGYFTEIIQCSGSLIFNTTPYAAASTINLITDTATVAQFTIAPILNAINSTTRTGQFVNASATNATQCIENKAVYVQVPATDPTTGDSNIIIYAAYRIVTI